MNSYGPRARRARAAARARDISGAAGVFWAGLGECVSSLRMRFSPKNLGQFSQRGSDGRARARARFDGARAGLEMYMNPDHGITVQYGPKLVNLKLGQGGAGRNGASARTRQRVRRVKVWCASVRHCDGPRGRPPPLQVEGVGRARAREWATHQPEHHGCVERGVGQLFLRQGPLPPVAALLSLTREDAEQAGGRAPSASIEQGSARAWKRAGARVCA